MEDKYVWKRKTPGTQNWCTLFTADSLEVAQGWAKENSHYWYDKEEVVLCRVSYTVIQHIMASVVLYKREM